MVIKPNKPNRKKKVDKNVWFKKVRKIKGNKNIHKNKPNSLKPNRYKKMNESVWFK